MRWVLAPAAAAALLSSAALAGSDAKADGKGPGGKDLMDRIFANGESRERELLKKMVPQEEEPLGAYRYPPREEELLRRNKDILERRGDVLLVRCRGKAPERFVSYDNGASDSHVFSAQNVDRQSDTVLVAEDQIESMEYLLLSCPTGERLRLAGRPLWSDSRRRFAVLAEPPADVDAAYYDPGRVEIWRSDPKGFKKEWEQPAPGWNGRWATDKKFRFGLKNGLGTVPMMRCRLVLGNWKCELGEGSLMRTNRKSARWGRS